MKKFLTKTETQKHYVLKNMSKLIKNRSLGTLYYDIFEKENDIEFKESMPVEIGIIWLCSGYVDSTEFPKYKCPCCGKESLVPYYCVASVLSGAHVIKFHCLNCKERIAFNNIKEYFHLIRDYCSKNRDKMKNDRVYVKLKGKQTSLNKLVK
ncbi:MAG: hypothetical protein IKN42_04345 [Elusimicrobia bacterium]|nr:hypothetical protein [Elusimicrobiota bacterium]